MKMRVKTSIPRKISESCAACGTEVLRHGAKFCLVCGKNLREDYEPLDNYRAAHRMHGKNLAVADEAKTPIAEDYFAPADDSLADTVWACLVFSFVPYLGILFVPITLAISVFSIVGRRRFGHKKVFWRSIAFSLLILALQIFLWWLLYAVPERSRGI